MGLTMSYFAGTSGVLGLEKSDITKDGINFANTDKPLQIYWEILSFRCSSTIRLIVKYFLFMFFIASFIAMSSAIALGDKTGFGFVSSLCVYFGFALAQFAAIHYANSRQLGSSTTP
jgi:hypothetical protein